MSPLSCLAFALLYILQVAWPILICKSVSACSDQLVLASSSLYWLGSCDEDSEAVSGFSGKTGSVGAVGWWPWNCIHINHGWPLGAAILGSAWLWNDKDGQNEVIGELRYYGLSLLKEGRFPAWPCSPDCRLSHICLPTPCHPNIQRTEVLCGIP